MSKKCGIDGCKNLVEICCECKINNYFCVEHFVVHVKKVGNHLIHSAFMEIKAEQANKTIKEINHRLRQISFIKSELNKFSSELISFVTLKTKKIAANLNSDLHYYTSIKRFIQERGEIDREVYEKLSSSVQSSVQVPPNLDSVKDELNTFFESQFKLVEGENEDDDYFWIENESLVKINLDKLKKTRKHVNASITSAINSCKLPEGKFFVNSVGTGECYILDVDDGEIAPIENCPVNTYSGVIACIDKQVFMINGYSSPMNEKYSLSTKEWTKVATCPLTQHVNTGGVIQDKICLTCYYQNSAYMYDPKTDVYKAFLSLSKGYKIVGHGFILTSQWAYKQDEEKGWKNFPYRAKDSDCCYCMMNTYVFKKGRYLYFCNCSQKLYRFDTKLFEYKIVSYT